MLKMNSRIVRQVCLDFIDPENLLNVLRTIRFVSLRGVKRFVFYYFHFNSFVTAFEAVSQTDIAKHKQIDITVYGDYGDPYKITSTQFLLKDTIDWLMKIESAAVSWQSFLDLTIECPV